MLKELHEIFNDLARGEGYMEAHRMQYGWEDDVDTEQEIQRLDVEEYEYDWLTEEDVHDAW